MAALFYSPRLFPSQSSPYLSSAYRWSEYRSRYRLLAIFPHRFASNLHNEFASLSFHSRLGRTCIRRISADLGNPEESDRLEAEHFIGAGFEGSGEVYAGGYEGDALEEPDILLREKVEAASQLNEYVQSFSTTESDLADGGAGGGNINSGGGDGSGGNDGEDEGESGNSKKKMSASQVITLVYATLVGVGGVIGYAKSKSRKSLISGVISSLVLYYVSTQLPKNPVHASSVGLGISMLLLTVMGIRFKRSGKFFPAGLVSVVSLIMTGGYVHGIMRSSHA